ncbi:hypothetical protein KI809_15225 [Geobacter pelophilus]|uniref:NHL repeat-containing protein n=1 Tax=Geoanaerobacter pelophilus TaxID=60036 RepID=A0AAW4L7Z6_9BACT|nr:6-bladed beta-propeller [Geoanaerobacter pelophilus]MBT0665660.1 hypothetical protein [Geoanaerobacter pelophilus]
MIARFTLNIIRSIALLAAFAGSCLAAASPAVTNLPLVTSHISSPVKLATDQFMNIYLTDPRGGGINKYDRTGKWVASIAIPTPQGMAVTAGEDLVVSQKNKVTVFSSAGTARFTLKDSQGATFVFKYANGVAIDPVNGTIFVTDSLDDCVLVFNAQGQPVNTGVAVSGKPANSFGSSGNGSGQFATPTGIAFEKKSRQLAVADTFNGRVQFFDLSYAYQKSIGSLGSGQLAFTSPEGIAFEYTKDATQSLSRMYLLDSFQSRVQVIDPTGNGTFLKEIGGYGRNPGQLKNPSDVIFDNTNNRLIVANGLGSLTAYAVDGGATPGNVDVTPPNPFTITPTADFTTNQSSFTFSGTVEKGAVVAVSANTAAVIGPVTYSSASPTVNVWSVTVSSIAAGANIFTFNAYDSANNPATLTRTVTFSAANAVALTLNAVTSPTNNTAQTLTGTMDSGATVAVTANTAAVIGATSYPTATTWSVPVTGLVAGANSFTIVGSLGGKTSSTIAATINAVLTPPDMDVSTLASGSTTATKLVTVRGAVVIDENFDRVTVAVNTVNNGAPVTLTLSGGTFAHPVILTAGANTIVTTVYDKAGNSASDSRTINYDPTIAQTTITSTAATNGSVTTAATLDFAGTAPAGTTSVQISYLASGTPTTVPATLGTGTWTATGINLDNGLNTIQATAMNGASQLNSAVMTVTRVAADKPTLTVSSPVNDLTTGSTAVTVSGSAGAAAVSAALDGAAIPATFAPGAPGTFTLSQSGLGDGTHLVAITATDAFGNSVTSYRSIWIKTSPPADFTLNSFTGQTTTLSGQFAPGSTVYIRDANANNLVPPQIVGATGTWAITLSTPYDPATMNLFGLDPAGNSTRNGRLANDNSPPDITDVIRAMRMSVGINQATPTDLLRGDVAPPSRPDGKINIFDVVVILETILGL